MKKSKSRADNIQKLVIDVEVSWAEIEVTALKRLDDLKSILRRWTDYTDVVRDLMTWLRSTEEKVNFPLHTMTKQDLNERLQLYQVRIYSMLNCFPCFCVVCGITNAFKSYKAISCI